MRLTDLVSKVYNRCHVFHKILRGQASMENCRFCSENIRPSRDSQVPISGLSSSTRSQKRSYLQPGIVTGYDHTLTLTHSHSHSHSHSLSPTHTHTHTHKPHLTNLSARDSNTLHSSENEPVCCRRLLTFFTIISVTLMLGFSIFVFHTILNDKTESSHGTQPTTTPTTTTYTPPPSTDAGTNTGGGMPKASVARGMVRDEFMYGYRGYTDKCFGKDTLKPLSGTCDDSFMSLALTMVDSLDTMHIMGLMDEFDRAKNYISTMNMSPSRTVSVFETTIRELGGLLSAYALSHEETFKQKALELAVRIKPAFSHDSIPQWHVNLYTGSNPNPSSNLYSNPNPNPNPNPDMRRFLLV